MTRWFIVMVLLAASAGCAPRGEPGSRQEPELQMKAELIPKVIHVGGPAVLEFTGIAPSGAVLHVPEFGEHTGGLLIKNRTRRSESLEGKGVLTRIRYDLTSFSPGNHVACTALVRCVLSDGRVVEKPFPRVTLTVESVLGTRAPRVRDIKGIRAWSQTADPIRLLLLLVAGFGIVWLVVLLIRGHGAGHGARRELRPADAYAQADKALEDLLAGGWIEGGQGERFYVRLSAVARRYVEDRFGVRATRRTTDELRSDECAAGVPARHRQTIALFLEESDMVKFARVRPDKDAMRSAYALTRRFVEETREE